MPEEKNNTPSNRKSDRRKKPTPFLSRYTFVGRRRAARRGEEKYNYYIDRLGGRVWIIIIIIILFSIIDSVFTLYFLSSRGYREVNPLMNIAIFIGKPFFILSKYIFTIIGILVLSLHINFIFVKELITVIISLYILLNIYHVWLFIH